MIRSLILLLLVAMSVTLIGGATLEIQETVRKKGEKQWCENSVADGDECLRDVGNPASPVYFHSNHQYDDEEHECIIGDSDKPLSSCHLSDHSESAHASVRTISIPLEALNSDESQPSSRISILDANGQRGENGRQRIPPGVKADYLDKALEVSEIEQNTMNEGRSVAMNNNAGLAGTANYQPQATKALFKRHARKQTALIERNYSNSAVKQAPSPNQNPKEKSAQEPLDSLELTRSIMPNAEMEGRTESKTQGSNPPPKKQVRVSDVIEVMANSNHPEALDGKLAKDPRNVRRYSLINQRVGSIQRHVVIPSKKLLIKAYTHKDDAVGIDTTLEVFSNYDNIEDLNRFVRIQLDDRENLNVQQKVLALRGRKMLDNYYHTHPDAQHPKDCACEQHLVLNRPIIRYVEAPGIYVDQVLVPLLPETEAKASPPIAFKVPDVAIVARQKVPVISDMTPRGLKFCPIYEQLGTVVAYFTLGFVLVAIVGMGSMLMNIKLRKTIVDSDIKVVVRRDSIQALPI